MTFEGEKTILRWKSSGTGLEADCGGSPIKGGRCWKSPVRGGRLGRVHQILGEPDSWIGAPDSWFGFVHQILGEQLGQ